MIDCPGRTRSSRSPLAGEIVSGLQRTAANGAAVTKSDAPDKNRTVHMVCTTARAYTGTACPAAGNTHLKVDYLYDYRNRLVGTRTCSAGALTASTDIAIDALDRPVSQTSGGATTTFAYTGTSNRVATEVKGSVVRSYGYGAYGERLTITDGANRYSYLYSPHGDVSVLVDQANTVKQAYGYAAYGGVDTTITKSAASFTDPNPYRYSAKRWDAATGTYDMGARRYNPATTRWVQQDMYYGSLEDLGLSRDPLTANRYQFTGANPINYIEIDGHFFGDTDGGGYGSSDAEQRKAAKAAMELLECTAGLTGGKGSSTALFVGLCGVAYKATIDEYTWRDFLDDRQAIADWCASDVTKELACAVVGGGKGGKGGKGGEFIVARGGRAIVLSKHAMDRAAQRGISPAEMQPPAINARLSTSTRDRRDLVTGIRSWAF